MKILAFVPARSGSKGLTHKNLVQLGEKSLIELAVQLGVEHSQVSEVYISTDSADYEQKAKSAGAKSFGLRSSDLAGDKIKTIDVILDFLSHVDESFTHFLLLQPTSPCRQLEDLSGLIKLMETSDVDGVVSVEKLEEPHPYKLKKMNDQGEIQPFLDNTSSEVPRQELPEAFYLNGAFYLNKIESLKKYKSLFGGRVLGYSMQGSINIDSQEDLDYIQFKLSKNDIKIFGVN